MFNVDYDRILKVVSPIVVVLTLAVSAFSQLHEYPCEEGLVEVMFVQESAVRLVEGELVDLSGLNAADGVESVAAAFGGGEWQRLCDVDEAILDEKQMIAEAELGEPVYNLNNIYRFRFYSGDPSMLAAAELQALPGVHLAYPVALPPELPTPPPYQASQNYLDPAASTPTGVDAYAAWGLTGGDGSGVTVCDIEYSWNYSHDDVTKAVGSQINLNTADPFADDNHGTAVIGQLVSDDNGWGTTGVCKGASLVTCGCYYGFPSPTWNVAGAMAVALASLQSGDVMLLEQQWDYTGAGGYVPIEWYPHQTPAAQSLTAVYAAIQNAVGNGVHVVQAGGNGGVDTDTMTWYGDSGAIIVGAGGAYTGGTYPNGDLQKLWYSSYGSRFDLQGWGENVVTTGYGDLFSAEGKNRWYTNSFSGTSSSSPIVAGAVACLSGWRQATVGLSPSPAVMRSTLVSTGTAQITPPIGAIGPRPDLAAAAAALAVPPMWQDVTAGPLGVPGFGKGVAWADYDLDGDPDLYTTNIQSRNYLLRNDGGGLFTDVTAAPEDNVMFSGGAMWGDFDNDGLPDIYQANLGGPNRIFKNLGGAFVDAGFPPVDDLADGEGVQWVDFDGDGFLDVYVTTLNGAINRMFQGGPGGMFADYLDPNLQDLVDAFDSAWADYDGDGDMDCFLVRALGNDNLLLRNDGGVFNPDPIVPPDFGDARGACWGDVDNDGDLDLYLVNYGFPCRLFRNDPGGFTDITNGPLGTAGPGVGAAFADYDNDGDLDLYLSNLGAANILMRNDGGGIFSNDTTTPVGDGAGGMGCAWADYDLDGLLDLYLVNQGSPNKLFRNLHVNGNHWLYVDLTDMRGNTTVMGARVQAIVAGTTQVREIGAEAGYCSQNDPRVEFGLGGFTTVDTLRVRWPDGTVTDTLSVAVDQIVRIAQPVVTGVERDDTPSVFALHGCTPNPFNPATTLRFELPRAGDVRLEIYDLAGRKLRTVERPSLEAGLHEIRWFGDDDRGRAAPAGVYLARIAWGGESRVVKMMLAK